MSTRTFIAPFASAIAALVLAGRVPGHPAAPVPVEAAPPSAQEASTTTIDDQVDLAVTVYNSDLALVRDTRTLRLGQGIADLHFMDIAATVNPASVHFRSVTDPSKVNVLEQNYEYDLLEPVKLLRKYVGRDVTLVRRRSGGGGTTSDEEVTAHLLSFNGAPVWKIGNEIVTGLQADHIRFPELPGNLYSRPTLIWTLDNRGGAQHRVEASYLATKLSWNADYVLTVGRDDKTADLDGWVTVHNESGTAFPHARLQLVAGELNRIRPILARAVAAEDARMDAVAAPQMSQESFSDYHLYTLERKTSVNDNETKQVSMLNATGFPVIKRYIVDGQSFYYRSARPGSSTKDAVQVYYDLKNEAKAGLGLPLPGGAVRVYQADSRGGTQFVGEDRIAHTPKDETISLKIGNAFDVTSEHRQADFERIASNVFEFEYEITLRNHKTIPVTVDLNEPIGGTWRMVRASHEWTKTSAWAAQFKVPVAVDGTVVVKYRVRVTY